MNNRCPRKLDARQAAYTYDAAGQRTSSVVTQGSVTTTSTYTYEGLALLSLDGTSEEGTAAASWRIDYLADSTGRPYGGIYTSGETSAVAFGIVTTDRGDVRELTDGTGEPFARYDHDAYGNPTRTLTAATAGLDAATAAAIAERNILRHAGYAFDEHSGLYYLSQRYYDPATCQFITKDPAKADGEESAYQYCGGDPVGKVDPSGEIALALPQLGIAFVGLALAAYLLTPAGKAALRTVIRAFGVSLGRVWCLSTAYTSKSIIYLAKGGKSGLNDKAREALDRATREAAKSGKNRSVDQIKRRAGEIAREAYKKAKNSGDRAKWKEAEKQLGSRRSSSSR